MSSPKPRKMLSWGQIALVIVLSPVLLVLAVPVLIAYLAASVLIHVAIWAFWSIRGRDILFVYSDSPTWQAYIEAQFLPHLGKRAVIVNWSRRKGWRLMLARAAVSHFGGWREFNPMAVVFRPFRRSRVFRFWQPFRDFKHGRPDALQRLQSDFFSFVSIPTRDVTS